MDERGCRNGAFLSEEAQCQGLWERLLYWGALEGMLRKAPDTGMSLHRGPLCPRGTWNQEGGLVYGGH